MKTPRTLLAAALLSIGMHAAAHDTWFAPQADALALTTGNRFPVGETAVDVAYFAKSGCRAADGTRHRLSLHRYTDQATLLRGAAPATGISCFVQLMPLDVELAPDKVEVYFREIRPSAAAVAAWELLRARGLAFRERYTKSARIDLGAQPASAPLGTAMDVLREPAQALRVGDEATFQLLRGGKPLADFPVELVNERSPVGLWQRTDADGRFRSRLPLAGRWLLRGTDLRVVGDGDAARFESDFVTYAFEVAR